MIRIAKIALLAALLIQSTFCLMETEAAPRLTVVVAVEGMHQQDLSMLRTYWPQGGMRTLSEEAFQTEVEVPHLVYGGAETLVTLMTGTTPQEHGIAMNSYYSKQDRKPHAIFDDSSYKGIGTQLRLSPRAILSSTLADRFRLTYGNGVHVYAIGLDPYATISLAGHSANACCWFDAEQLRWVTTTYYSEGLPSAADKMNTSHLIEERSARVWEPRMDVAQYLMPSAAEKKKPYSYTGFQGGHAPIANELVVQLALDIQQDKKLGTSMTPDMLLLEMTVLSPKAAADHIGTAEQEDMYLSINQNLGYLIEQLDKRIGHDHYQLLVVGLPRKGSSEEILQRSGIPCRNFNVDRAAALIGTYLMAIYGHERWVDGGYGQTIFLNRTLIEQKKLSLETLRRQVSDFLLEFEGVQGAAPSTEIPLLQGSAEVSRLRQSISKHTRGDVDFWLEENWRLMEKEDKPIDHVIDRSPRLPLLLWSGSYRNYPDRRDVTALSLWELLFE